MSTDINIVCLSGNLTRDPELQATSGGTAVLRFGIAVNTSRKNQQGNWEDYPNFIDCVMFGARAQSLASILKKGMQVSLQGKLRYSSWEKDGQRRSKLEVIADEVKLPQRPKGQQQASYTSQPQPQAYQAPRPQAPQQPQFSQAPLPQQQAPAADVYDEDIPF